MSTEWKDCTDPEELFRLKREGLEQQLADCLRVNAHNLNVYQKAAKVLQEERDTAWAQAHRLALELECLIMDTKDNAVVSKWWDPAFEAMEEYHKLKPSAAEDAEAWAKMRKAGV